MAGQPGGIISKRPTRPPRRGSRARWPFLLGQEGRFGHGLIPAALRERMQEDEDRCPV